jgi:1-phosphofructokinase family hexose kinase
MIITVTLNPAIDETVEVEHLAEADTNRVLAIRRDIGGKGINVARVLRELGYEALATGLAPGNFGRAVEDLLLDAGIGCDFVAYPGEARTNINIVDRSTHKHTVLATPGAAVPAEVIGALRERLLRRVRPDTWLVLAGSLPPGVTPALHCELIEAVTARGGWTALDADGPVAEHVLSAGALPTLLKMNDHELERLLHVPMNTEQAVFNGARLLHRRGVPNVVITRGGEGALAITAEGEFRVLPPVVQVDSAVGAGDGFLAGLLLGLKQGLGWERALALAAATGSAVCLSPGTTLCRASEVQELIPFTVVEPLRAPSPVT